MNEETTHETTNAALAATEQCRSETPSDRTTSAPVGEARQYTIFDPQGPNDQGELPVDPAHWVELLAVVSDLLDEGSSVRLRDGNGDYVECVDEHLTRIGCTVGIRNHCVT